MLLTVYNDAFDNSFYDSSGVRAHVGSGFGYTSASKLMVGHHMSSKMILMPSSEWVVQGVCSSSCTGDEDISDEEEVSRHAKGFPILRHAEFSLHGVEGSRVSQLLRTYERVALHDLRREKKIFLL